MSNELPSQQMFPGRLESVFFVKDGHPAEFYSTHGSKAPGHASVQIRFHTDGDRRPAVLAENLTPEYAAQCLLQIQAAYAERDRAAHPGQLVTPNQP